MAGNNYTVVLQAIVNAAALQTYLSKLKLTVPISGVITNTGVPPGTPPTTPPTTLPPTTPPTVTGGNVIRNQMVQEAASIKAVTAAWEAKNATITRYINAAGDVTKISAKYDNGLRSTITETAKLNAKTGQWVVTQKNVAGAIDNTADKTKGWSKQIENNTAKVIQWAVATMLIYGTLKKIGEGIKYITELNKVMTDTRIVTGMSQESANVLATQYNQLAVSIGATTKQVAEGTIEWFRQGKTQQEAIELTKASMMMSKLANMESAQATEYLTSIINGFKLSAEDVIPVLDRLVALDNNYATSVAEIASAMQRSAAAAQLSKVSLGELASYITIVSATTRKSAIKKSCVKPLTNLAQCGIIHNPY